MLITLLGLSHKTAPIDVRERLHIEESRLPALLRDLREVVPEGLVFSTCNRFEILANQTTEDDGGNRLADFIAHWREIPRKELEPFLYRHNGPAAVRHIFRVTSSLDSLVVGESQILGQMKQSYSIAQTEKTIGYALNLVMERAFMVAKKVRTETSIASNPVSVSSVAVELSTKIFDRLEGKTALIIGAGKMSLLAIQHLQSKGVRMILVTNRSFAKAAEVAEQVSGRAVPFDSVVDCLGEADIVISSTGSGGFIIRRDHAQRAMNLRKNRPMFFIDIAVPRNIDPQVNEIDNVFVYDIDDLKAVAEKNRTERLKEAERAEEIVAREAEMFWSKLKALDITPMIREIQSRIEEMRRHEIELTLKKMGELTQDQKQAIDQLTSSLTNKILQSSFSELRQLANQPDSSEKIQLIRKLFRL